jgi:hypothetical protein
MSASRTHIKKGHIMNSSQPLTSYADVQKLLDAFVQSAGVTPANAPHGVFWHDLTYEQFVNGNVPGVSQPQTYKILVKGSAKDSNIIQILSGMGSAYQNFGQMPQPNPPYPGQQDLINSLSQWINAGCPNK